jgi:uncharacterized repeat protein (TIGR01451 family)
MNTRTSNFHTIGYRLIVVLSILAMLAGSPGSMVVSAQTGAAPAMATSNTLHLSVVSAADSSAAVNDYKYIINIDNTGTTTQRSPEDGCSPSSPGYPGSCNWVSVAGRANNSPIFTQGDSSDFGPGIDLPPGRYLVSVLADGFKLDGEHFTVPITNSGNVTVQMQPWDLPDATVQAAVFEDTAPTNSAPDVPVERGLAGFKGHITDYIDEVTTDVYGNPICGNGQCLSKCYVVDGGVDVGIVSPIDAAGHCPYRSELPANATTTDTHLAISANAVIEGKLKIPNVGPNRYALSIVPPDNSGWIQTTTLEGNHDWDAWVMEGATGLDTEFAVAGEPFPATFFGYVRTMRTMPTGGGTIKGTALAVSAYVPPTGGITGELGLMGAKPKDKNPIHTFFVSLSDVNNGDQTVYVGKFTCNEGMGCPAPSYTIPNVPDGDYFIGIWDEPQDYIFAEQNVSVRNGEVVDMGAVSMLGWWSTMEGHVFSDDNANGRMDPGEAGIPNFTIVMRTRENSIMDRGTTAVTTDANGYYWMESLYPMTQWLVEEAYADGFKTTGITYQADNQPDETTILGQGVDVNVHPIIGLGGRLDWGVQAYAPGENGGIVGTISYDTTRNELNPQYAAIEDWQPSIAGLTVNLYAPEPCVSEPDPITGEMPLCDPMGLYSLNEDGSYKLGQLLNQYTSETWERPSGCVARNVYGDPLQHGVDENALPLGADDPCLEAPMMGVQFGPMAGDVGTPDENFGASVDGNYGFGDGCFGAGGFNEASVALNSDSDPNNDVPACADGTEPISLASNADYLVKVVIPTESDAYGPDAVHPDRPLYQVTREEDINVAFGDSFVPQIPPPSCAGSLHTVDLAGDGTDGYAQVTGTGYEGNGIALGVTVPASDTVDNAPFLDMGGTVYEGQAKPLCDVKLIHLSERQSIAPGFNFFTDVPVPGRFWGLLVDDLNFSSNPQSLSYGEKMGIPFAPVGIYDYTNRLITTVESDYNGLFDVLLPSTNRISCPTPSGVCANLYRFVGNDPGAPGRWNANYTPQYRTIAAEFEAFAGLTVPADLAPTQVAVGVQIPGMQTLSPIACGLGNDMDATTPAATAEFFRISDPLMYTNAGGAARTFTITGLGFGNSAGSVSLDNLALNVGAWTDTSITFTVPSLPSGFEGPHQLKIATANGAGTINAITFHILSPGTGNGPNTPQVYRVGPGQQYATIQSALEAAASSNSRRDLVVVYPGAPDTSNPRINGRGVYYENLIIHSLVKLQGVGPGGVYPTGSAVSGSMIDGLGFGGDTALADAWRTLISGLTWDGNQDVSEGQVVYVLAQNGQFGNSNAPYSTNFRAAIDGFDIRGGDQMGFPGNLNAIFGGYPGPAEGPNAETQGGAIFVNAYARNLQISNNVIEQNGGSYGAIRVGTPNLAAPDTNQHNENLKISNNRIIANAGTNLAGAIGLFNGADNYEVANNDLCGNFSAEYGGAISHFGYSPNGLIHDNRIYFNRSYDEGAGIMIAGELPVNPNANYGTNNGPKGSGAVNIYNNLIQSNLADDDGGGIRFLMAASDCNSSSGGLQACAINVYNNMIVNNVSTHEGGGVALDDAPNVRFYNNTVMNNKTTATALTSDGTPAPAGLSTGKNSTQLQAVLSGSAANFSNPVLFNNVFYNNWAGTRGVNNVTGIGGGGPGDVNSWDMGVYPSDGVSRLSPTNSVLQSNNGVNAAASNSLLDPKVIGTHDIPLTFTSWRTNVNFIGAIMVTADLPPALMGNYHLDPFASPASPAKNTGAASKSLPTYQQPPTTLSAPAFDFDNQGRPALGSFDMGADEIPALADLSITKTDGKTTVQRGEQIRYTIVASNAGPENVTGATIADTFPSALSGTINWTCATTGGATCGGPASGSGNINRTVNIPMGGTVSFTTTSGSVSNSATGSFSNTATVTAPAGITESNPGNNSATDTDSIPTADLSISMSRTPLVVPSGGSVTYSITVANLGPDAVTGAGISDTIPAGMTGATWTCAASGGATCPAASGSGNISGLANLPATTGTVAFTLTGNVTAAAGATLSNTATVTVPVGVVDPSTGNNTATNSTNVVPPIHIGDLDVSAANQSGNNWQASVTVTVHNANHSNAGVGTIVSGTWSSGNTGEVTCIIGFSGTCTLSRTFSRATVSNATFTVTNVVRLLPLGGYLPSANHDPDSGAQASNGTTITANRP